MIKMSRVLMALLVLAGLCGVAYVRQAAEGSGARMTHAAEAFLSSLNAEQRAKAVYSFDDAERFNWHFVPLQDKNRQPTRKGLRLEEMTESQKEAAMALLRSGTSTDGYTKATTIMSLESILAELEKGRTIVRSPGWYFVTIFGAPSATSKWGWRVEGHHLSLNFTLDAGKVVSATPAFFGANPASVLDGPRKGTRALPDSDDLARQLFNSLDEEQKKIALQDKQFPEVAGQTRAPKSDAPRGLAGAKMTDQQKDLLQKLVKAYARRMPDDIASQEITGLEKSGVDQIHFAYAGETEQGKPHTYRVQGPMFVIEFLNVQADSANNPANHIHSAWRNTKGDFGLTQARP